MPHGTSDVPPGTLTHAHELARLNTKKCVNEIMRKVFALLMCVLSTCTIGESQPAFPIDIEISVPDEIYAEDTFFAEITIINHLDRYLKDVNTRICVRGCLIFHLSTTNEYTYYVEAILANHSFITPEILAPISGNACIDAEVSAKTSLFSNDTIEYSSTLFLTIPKKPSKPLPITTTMTNIETTSEPVAVTTIATQKDIQSAFIPGLSTITSIVALIAVVITTKKYKK